MKVRSLDQDNDWTFGKGKGNYRKDKDAIQQEISTKLKSFLGDCYFDLAAGIDWFNLNSQKDVNELKRAISAVLLNIEGMTKVDELSLSLSENRAFTIAYSVDTIYGVIESETTQEVA